MFEGTVALGCRIALGSARDEVVGEGTAAGKVAVGSRGDGVGSETTSSATLVGGAAGGSILESDFASKKAAAKAKNKETIMTMAGRRTVFTAPGQPT